MSAPRHRLHAFGPKTTLAFRLTLEAMLKTLNTASGHAICTTHIRVWRALEQRELVTLIEDMRGQWAAMITPEGRALLETL